MNARWLVFSSSVGWLRLLTSISLAQSATDPLEGLHEACRLSDYEAIQAMPLAAIDLSKKGASSGRAALHWAVEGRARRADDRLKVVTLLVERGADVNQKSSEGLRPLHYACREGWDQRIVELLIKHGANVDDPGGFSRLAPPGTPLSFATARLDLPLVQLLIAKGAKIEIRVAPEYGAALHRVYGSGGAYDEEPRKSRALKVLKALLDAGTDPNSKDARGYTPLHLAALAGHVAGVEELASRGAALDVTTNEKETAAHLAVHKPMPGVQPILEFLTRRNSKLINQRDASGNTPLHTAVSYGSSAAVQSLLLLGADAGLKNSKGLRPDDLMETLMLDEPTRRMLQKYSPPEAPPARPPVPRIPPRTPLPNKA
jgi:ankyrin repeat protein